MFGPLLPRVGVDRSRGGFGPHRLPQGHGSQRSAVGRPHPGEHGPGGEGGGVRARGNAPRQGPRSSDVRRLGHSFVRVRGEGGAAGAHRLARGRSLQCPQQCRRVAWLSWSRGEDGRPRPPATARGQGASSSHRGWNRLAAARSGLPFDDHAAAHGPERSRAVRRGVALGEFGPEAKPAIPALVELLKDKSADVRGAAAVALERIGPEAATAAVALAELLKEPAHESPPRLPWLRSAPRRRRPSQRSGHCERTTIPKSGPRRSSSSQAWGPRRSRWSRRSSNRSRTRYRAVQYACAPSRGPTWPRGESGRPIARGFAQTQPG